MNVVYYVVYDFEVSYLQQAEEFEIMELDESHVSSWEIPDERTCRMEKEEAKEWSQCFSVVMQVSLERQLWVTDSFAQMEIEVDYMV